MADGRSAARVAGRGLAAALALGVAGCSGGPAPAPAPASAGVPSIVGDPLDLSRAATDPCALLRPDQLAQYHLRTPGTPAAGPVPGCGWSPVAAGLPDYRAAVDLRSGGLAALYRHRPPAFAATTVSEYPAVHTAATPADLRRGHCVVEVGVAGDTLLVAEVRVVDPASLDYPDPCPAADAFAATIIANAEGHAP